MQNCSKKWKLKMKMIQSSRLSLGPFSLYLTVFAVSVRALASQVAYSAIPALAIAVAVVALAVEWLAAAKSPILSNNSRGTSNRLKQRRRMHVSEKSTGVTSSESRTQCKCRLTRRMKFKLLPLMMTLKCQQVRDFFWRVLLLVKQRSLQSKLKS